MIASLPPVIKPTLNHSARLSTAIGAPPHRIKHTKPIFHILAAAAAAVAALIRLALGDDGFTWIDPDAPSPMPRLTAKMVEHYAFCGASDAEIADRFLVDAKVIRDKFPDVLRSTRALRKMTLRSWQTELAKKLNGPALIWIGRNELGQSLSPAVAGKPMPEVDENEDSPEA